MFYDNQDTPSCIRSTSISIRSATRPAITTGITTAPTTSAATATTWAAAMAAATACPAAPAPAWAASERGRKLASDDLHLLILALLAERASHGYELIKEFDQRSGGYYVPSPGMIYPALSFAYLDEVDCMRRRGRRREATPVTVAGLAQLDEHRAAVEAMWAQLAALRQDAHGAPGPCGTRRRTTPTLNVQYRRVPNDRRGRHGRARTQAARRMPVARSCAPRCTTATTPRPTSATASPRCCPK